MRPTFLSTWCHPMSRALIALPVLVLLMGCRGGIPDPPPRDPLPAPYPVTQMGSQGDDYHGNFISDPYRWLEEPSPQRDAWVEAQNRLSGDYLARVTSRDQIRQRLEQLWNTERYGIPFKEGSRYFLTHNDGLQNQNVLYTLDALDAERKLLLDPNKLSEGGTVSAGNYSVSPDGRYLAYSLSDGGSDWKTFKVREIATGNDLSDELHWIKFASASWSRDSLGFYYTRYDEPSEELQSVNQSPKICYHKLGTPQSADEVVYERPDHPDWFLVSWVTEDGSYLMVYARGNSSHNNALFAKDLSKGDSKVEPVLERFDARYYFVHNVGSKFYLQTDANAARWRVIAVDAANPRADAWQEIIPESVDAIDESTVIGDHLVLTYLQDAASVVRIYDLAGRFQRQVSLPGIGSVSEIKGKPNDPEAFFAFSSFTQPTQIYRTDVTTGETTLFREVKFDFDPRRYTVEQVFYESEDGTRVPMFLTYATELVRDGGNPCLLYGYGGFNISITPRFSASTVVWLEMGGIYAVANIRGGGEYGREWHRAGTRHNKQNVFDDFIAAGEWLIDQGFTNTSKLAISGRSNGGLLVGACMTQRPDLYGACLPAVGVLDMLRYHKFTVGSNWIPDYGSPDDPADFEALYAYSPLHNIKEGTCYPPTLITTGDRDDRVVPAHSYKFASALQAAQSCPNPILIRITTQAGHGAGKPTNVRIEEQADQWSFLTRALRMNEEMPKEDPDSP